MGQVAPQELTTTAVRLLADVAARPWGSVSASVYETARLVTLAPWLAGHAARLDHLCQTQHPDGSWSGPDGYAVVPTLSATAALLTELARQDQAPRPAIGEAARRGLRAVGRWLERGGWLDPVADPPVPDTVAVELMVPALLSELADLLPPGMSSLLPPRLIEQVLDGDGGRRLTAIRARVAVATPPPEQSHHCLELLGPAAVAAPFVRLAEGAVAASAAATARWLGGPDGPPASLAFLERAQRPGEGTVPNVTPISYFETAWVLNTLAVGGLAARPPTELLDRLEAGLTDLGCPAGPGLPVDADDTAGVLTALLRFGRARPPTSLLAFHGDEYFRCFAGERNPSVSANAHVLEALTLYLARCPDDHSRFAAPAAAVASWLLDQQDDDGCWWDKWHASPYYATACCVLALSLRGGSDVRRAIDRAVRWVLDGQRPDGGWGRWQSTIEETAYALHVLAEAGSERASGSAVARGRTLLADPPPLDQYPPLWHGKDLYTPIAVVEAARLAALRLATSSPD